ncbi:MAG: MetQ/NlpA family ABC transporter substrate-binding protein [Erysipelothrix sp.]|nr:MetQ/NlpA family ABC transporter substrate-binding protein [Erysipelothrix sp.]
MKKIILSILFIALLVACGSKGTEGETGETENKKVVLGVVGEPYKYWDPVIEKLKADGIDLELKVYSEYSIPNNALNAGDIDINAFQHYLYLNQEIENFDYKITVLGDTIVDPLGLYTKKVENLDSVPEGATILIPDDISNGGRALKLLEAAGLIEVDPAKGYLPSVLDITSNPKNLEIKSSQSDLTPSLLEDVDLAVINGDLAISFGLKPSEDTIYLEELDFEANPAAKELINVLVVREGDEKREELLKIKEYFQSEEVKAIFEDYYFGAFKAAWEY